MSREKGLGSSLGYTVREREFEILGEELLDVWALDIVGLLELDDFENLSTEFSKEEVGSAMSD